MGPSGNNAFSGTRATYLAIAAVSILTLALFTSIWHSDVSGSVALLGLLSVYLCSSELLTLFIVLAPLSALVDCIRLSGPHQYNRRSWLLFFSILEIVAKAAGTVFAWSLHRSIATGEASNTYQPMGYGAPGGMTASQMAGAPQHDMHMGGGPPGYDQPPDNPFSSYAPPRSDGMHNNGVSTTYQPFPSNQSHL